MKQRYFFSLPRPSIQLFQSCGRRYLLRLLLGAGASAACLSAQAAASAASEIATNTEFEQCVQRLRSEARAEGIDAGAVKAMLDPVSYQARVIELDRKQPEFTATFGNYYERRVTQRRIDEGQAMLVKHADLLRRLTLEYGVPGHYLLAFWGLETNFGGYLGTHNVVDALATLACDPRRSQFFTTELMNVMRVHDRNGLPREKLLGSWAGAMGNMQFMPSNYLRYGRDGDGDGKIDLWGSVPDALTSAAYFLQSLGWETGLRWGREVRLPKGFDYSLAGRQREQSLQRWRELGVTDRYGNPLPKVDVKAALIIPAGHTGPAFLAYHNFNVIMRWNRSEFYGIAVGRLADRIQGAGPLAQSIPQQDAISKVRAKRMQARLNELGFDTGKPDGILGSRTRAAIREYQQQQGWIADGYPAAKVLDALAPEADL